MELNGHPLQHAQAFIKINEIGFIEFAFCEFFQVTCVQSVQEQAHLRVHFSLLDNLLGHLLFLLGLHNLHCQSLGQLHKVIYHVL